MTRTTTTALAERATVETVLAQSRRLVDVQLLTKLYDAVNESILVLNRQRQIVFCNRHFAEMLGVSRREQLYGKRPGEAIGCAAADASADGCGTGEQCAFCGALTAILACRDGQGDVLEARILRGRPPEAMDLLVRTSPLTLDGERFAITAITDISHEKRRRALERIFFHDLLNTATGMRMFSEILPKTKPERLPEIAVHLNHGLGMLFEQIASQRDLMSAEKNELVVDPAPISSRSLLSDVMESYQQLAATHGCRLVLDDGAQNVSFVADATILYRVLANMIKNAVEASAAGDVVRAGCERTGGFVKFWSNNPAVMPREVQLQLFNRSFTTKGPGRGLGTYSMRLLTERYLKGTVSVQSNPTAGTTFSISCPLTAGGGN